MMKKQIPPYLLGLPQWPGTVEIPLTGQALAEWHADKTTTIGADVFADDLCGDYFPPSGLPLNTWCGQGNADAAGDIYFNTSVSIGDIKEIKIYYEHTTYNGAWGILNDYLFGAYFDTSSRLNLSIDMMGDFYFIAGSVTKTFSASLLTIGQVYEIDVVCTYAGSTFSNVTLTISDLQGNVIHSEDFDPSGFSRHKPCGWFGICKILKEACCGA